jgi:hypothetical protein
MDVDGEPVAGDESVPMQVDGTSAAWRRSYLSTMRAGLMAY